MARYPFEFYARYLILVDNLDAVESLRADGFDIDAQDFSDLVFGMGRYPQMRNPPSTRLRNYAEEHRIGGLLTKMHKAPYQMIMKVLRECDLRQVIELLLVTNLKLGLVAELFTEGTGVEMSEWEVQLYEHYFWNKRIMSRLNWYTFLFDNSLGGTPISKYPNALDIWSFLHIPIPLALYKMGFHGRAKIDKAEALNDIFNMAYVKASEEIAVGNTLGFQKASTVAIQAYDSSRASSTDIGDLMNRLTGSVRLITKETEIGSIDSVSGGHHTSLDSITTLVPRSSDGDTDRGPEESPPAA